MHLNSDQLVAAINSLGYDFEQLWQMDNGDWAFTVQDSQSNRLRGEGATMNRALRQALALVRNAVWEEME